MRTLLLCTVIAMVAGLTTVQFAAAADMDPVVGTWRLDAAKSTFKSGSMIKSQTRTYSQSGNQITVEIKSVSAEGKDSTTHTTYELNGKSFPVEGTPDYNSLSGKQINPNTARFTLMKDGKVVGTTTRTVSKDGKTLTSTNQMTTASGGKQDYVLVFEKQ